MVCSQWQARWLAFFACSLFYPLQSALAAPVNDQIANALTIPSTLPVTIEADTRQASLEKWEPDRPSLFDFAGTPAGSVWYRWISPVTATIRIEAGSPNDLVGVGAFLGTDAARLVPPTGRTNISAGIIDFPATAGTTYTIGLYSLNGGDSSFVLREQNSLPNDNRSTPTTLPPTLPTRQVSPSYGASRNAIDDPPNAGTTIWWQWTAPSDGRCHARLESPPGTPQSIWIGIDSWDGVASGLNEAIFQASAGVTYLICVGQAVSAPSGLTGLSIEEFTPAENSTPVTALTLPSAITVHESGLILANDPATYYWTYTAPKSGSYRTTITTEGEGTLNLTIDGAIDLGDGTFVAPADDELLISIKNASPDNHWSGKFSFSITQSPTQLPNLSANALDVGSTIGGLVVVKPHLLESIFWGQDPGPFAPIYFGGDSTPHCHGWLRWRAPHTGVYNLHHLLGDGNLSPELDRGPALAVFAANNQVLPINENSPRYADHSLPYYFNATAGTEYLVVVYSNYYTVDREFEIRIDPAPAPAPNALPSTAYLLPANSSAAFQAVGPIFGCAYWKWIAPQDGTLSAPAYSNLPFYLQPEIYLGNPDDGGITVPSGTPITSGQELFLKVSNLAWNEPANIRIFLDPPIEPEPISNDDFADASDLGSRLPIAARFLSQGATRELNEPLHLAAGSSTGSDATLWWQWTPTENALVALNINPGYSYSIYTGNTLQSLSPVETLPLHQSYSSYYPQMFEATSGTTYSIAAQGTPTSSVAELAIIPIHIIAPPNDTFLNRTDLGAGRRAFGFGYHRRYSSSDGTLELATIDADDPPTDPQLSESLWWKWQSTKNGIFAVRLSQNADAADIKVYHDAETASQLIEVAGTSVGWDGTLLFPVIDDEIYTIRIANKPLDLWNYQINIDAGNAYEIWARNHPILSGSNLHPNANPSNDGFSNLSALAFGLDPALDSRPAGNDPNKHRSPAIHRLSDGSSHLRFYLDQDAMNARDGGIDIDIFGVRCNDLKFRPWTLRYESPSALGDGWFSLQITPTRANEPREFLRIQVRQ